jgi:hypothetical protein
MSPDATAGNIAELDRKIRQLRGLVEEILDLGDGIEAVKRNGRRILASTAMLEMNVCDVKDLVE